MFDADKSGDISAEDLTKFYDQCRQFRAGLGQPADQPIDEKVITDLVSGFDFVRHKAITPDQFFNMVMASYE